MTSNLTKSGKPRKKPGPKPKWLLNTKHGRWRIDLLQICRERGYVHTSGYNAGQIAVYRLAAETGLSPVTMYRLKRGARDRISLHVLGLLCDVLRCQPSDIMYREPAPDFETDEYELPD